MDSCCPQGPDKGPCESAPSQFLGMLGGGLLLLLFVRLLHDPHLPPRIYWLSWLAALVVMGRFAWHNAFWLVRKSPVAVPGGSCAASLAARLVVWHAFALGLLMAGFSTLGLLARLGGPGRPPGPPGPPPPPPPPPHPHDALVRVWDSVVHHGPVPPEGPGLFLGLALVFVPTALLCLAALPWAKQVLHRRELLRDVDRNAARAGSATILYGLAVMFLALEPSPERIRHGLMLMLCPVVLPNHAMASAAAAGVWKLWFLFRGGGEEAAPPSEEPAPEVPAPADPAPLDPAPPEAAPAADPPSPPPTRKTPRGGSRKKKSD